MTQLKLAELLTKYPKLFHPSFRFECGDGWAPLLDALLSQIQYRLGRWQEVQKIKQGILDKGEDLDDYSWIEEYFQKNPKDPLTCFEISRIKEKFGAMRFYWECAAGSKEMLEISSQIEGAVDLAQSLSTHYCEVCGSNTSVETRASKDKYWIRTLCQSHRQQDEASQEKTS